MTDNTELARHLITRLSDCCVKQWAEPGLAVEVIACEIDAWLAASARQAPALVEVSRLAGDFVEHSHPEFGQGYFCTPDVFAKIESAASTPVGEVPAGWRETIDEIRKGLDDATPSAYDNSGYRDYAATVLDAVEEELSALAANFSPSNPPRLRREGESVADYRAAMGWSASPSPAASMEVQGLSESQVYELMTKNEVYQYHPGAALEFVADVTRALAAKNGWRLGEGQ